MKLLFALIFASVFLARAQDLNAQWMAIDSLEKAGNFSQLTAKFPAFISELEKNKMEKQLIVAYFHYANALVKNGELLRADFAYNNAKEKATSENARDNYLEIINSQIINLYNAVRSSQRIDYGTASQILTNCYNYAKEIDNYSYRKLIQLLRIDNERKNSRYTGAGVLVKELLDDIAVNSPQDTDLTNKLNILLAELNLKTGRTDAASTENLTPEQFAQLMIHQALEYEKNGELRKSLETLSKIRPAQYPALKWELITELSKKRYELGNKLDLLDDVLSDLNEIRLLLISDSASLDISMLEFLKLIIIGDMQSGKIDLAYNEITNIEKALADGRVSSDFYPHFFRMRGDIAYIQGDFEDAALYYQKAADDHSGLKPIEFYSVLNNLGLAYYKNNRSPESIATFDKLYAAVSDTVYIGFSIQADINAGIAFLRDEHFPDALARFKRAQENAQKYNILSLNLIAGIRMAEVYYNQGFNDFASEKFRDVKKYVNDIKDPQEKINILAAIGLYERNLNNTEQALIYLNHAYTIAGQLNLTNLKLYLAGELGDTYLISGKADQANGFYRSLLPSASASKDLTEQVMLNIKISKCYFILRDYKTAADLLSASLKLINDSQKDYLQVSGSDLKDIYLYTLCLTELASNNYSAGLTGKDTRRVFQAYREATKATELSNAYFLTQLAGTKDNENSLKYLETYRLLVDISINLYLQTGDTKYLNQSFEVSEQSRARSFISEVGSNLLDKLNNRELQQVSSISKQIDAQNTKGTKGVLAMNGASLPGEGQKRGLKVIKDTTKSVVKLQNKYDEILSGLKKNKSKETELVSISTLTLPAVQQLINNDQIILNYFVSKESIYLFCIEKDTISLSLINISEDELRDNIQEVRKNIQNSQSYDFINYSAELYRKLISPVADRIVNKNLVIIPSGQLNNLPFSSLINEGRYLVEDHIITVLPNLSSLQFFRSKTPLNSNSGLIAIGNPVNDYTSPLPGAELEVQALQSIFKNNRTFFREDALESTAKQELPKGDIIHIACHGLFNYDYPLLSCLALAGGSNDDGRLELHEIYNLNLNKTSLVVLSACETALSQIKENDDMIGLVRGFLFTGASSVAASLWKVDDAGTYELMVKFYNNLAAGNSKGEALQKAQIEMIRSGKFAHPFYWSAFVLNGME